MSSLSRRLPPLGLVATLSLAALVVACGPAAGSSSAPPPDPTESSAPVPSSSEAPTQAPPTPALSVEPMTPGTSAEPSLGQTETEFGTIWDGVPAGFPRFDGGRDADDAAPDPVSDIYAVAGGDPALIAEWLQSAMETATYSTEGLAGPFEDGGYELVSVGDDGCRIQTTVTPRDGQVFVAVLYGAACPAA